METAHDVPPDTFYHPGYHDQKKQRSLHAARRILPLVLEACPIGSMADIGCGPFSWVRAARELELRPVIGVEGDWARAWIPPEIQGDDGVSLSFQDLEERVVLPHRVDLAVSLEVAEHLAPERGDSFIDDLCRAAPRVLFSAALPGQGGNRHVNEQWPSYWASRFARHGLKPLDIIRPRIWTDHSIPFWYRQNTILFVHESDYDAVLDRCAGPALRASTRLDLVHPRVYAKKNRPPPGVRETLRLAAGLPRHFLRRLRRGR